MKSYEELLRTTTFWQTVIQNELYGALEDYLNKNNMTRSDFAKQLGVSKGYVSQVLNGEFNHRLSKLVELSLSIGKVPRLDFENLEEVIKKESAGMVRRKALYTPHSPMYVSLRKNPMIESEGNFLQSTKSPKGNNRLTFTSQNKNIKVSAYKSDELRKSA